MTSQAELDRLIATYVAPEREQKKISIADLASQQLEREAQKESPLAWNERGEYGFMNRATQKEYLENKFGKGSVSENPDTGKYQVQDQEGNIKQVDPAGFESGDIPEMLGKTIVSGVSIPSAITQKLSLGVTTPVGAMLSGAAEAKRQQIGNLLAGKSNLGQVMLPDKETAKLAYKLFGNQVLPGVANLPFVEKKATELMDKYLDPNIDQGEVATEAVAGALAPGLTKAIPKVGTMLGKAYTGIKGLLPEAKAPTKAIMRDVSKQIAGGLQDSTVQNMANPYVRQNFKRVGAEEAEGIAYKAANKLKALSDDFNRIKTKAYSDAGITDQTSVPVKNALQSIQKKIDDFAKDAITADQEKAVLNARADLVRLTSKAKDGKLSFRQLRDYTNVFHDASEASKSVNDTHTPISKLYAQMRHELTNAKNNVSQIKNASGKFKKIIEVEDSLDNALRMGKDPDEINLERKILRRYKDKGNQEFKEQLEKIDKWLKSSPEASKHKHVIDEIKLAHVANDIETAKTISPSSSSRFLPAAIAKQLPGINPLDKMRTLKGLVDSGVINPKNLTKSFKYSDMPIIGDFVNAARARKVLYSGGNAPKAIGNALAPIVKPVSKVLTPEAGLKTGIRQLAQPAIFDHAREQENRPTSISELIKQKRTGAIRNQPVY